MTVILFLSLLSSFLHSQEELIGKGGPLWDNFGRIVGIKLPYPVGYLIFTLGLTATLWAISFCAYLDINTFWLSVLCGARLIDCIISHWLLRIIGKSDPNPGLYTTPFYFLEAVWIAYTYQVDILGFILGGAPFVFVLPLLWITGRFVKEWRVK